MKFKFRFKSILKVRRHKQKEEKQKLSELLSKQIQLKKAILIQQQKTQNFEGTASEDGSRSMPDVRRRYEQIHQIQKNIWRLESKKRELDEDIKKQRSRLMETNRQKRMLEKLEDREKAKFIEHQQHLEQMQQNEIATQMYNRLQ